MKTAEVAIEHILTGMLTLCAFLLPFLSEEQLNEGSLGKEAIVVGIIGLAYLVGVVFDRLADTILGPLEQRLRLKIASESAEKHRLKPGEDAFPQDALEYELRKESDGRTDWMDSLRSRIRTSRGLTVLGLPAGMGIAIYLAVHRHSVTPGRWSQGLVALNLLLLFASVMAPSFRWHKNSRVVELLRLFGAEKFLETLRPVRTNQLSSSATKRAQQVTQAGIRTVILSTFSFLMLLNSLIVIVALAPVQQLLGRAVLVLSLLIASFLPLLVWYRITETHMRFLYRGMPAGAAQKNSLAKTTSTG